MPSRRHRRERAPHRALIRAAAAQLVVFPELSLTGYDLDAPAVDPASRALQPIIEACGETGTTALVGAPVALSGGRYIATLAVTGQGAAIVYRKMFLGGDEPRGFRAGPKPASIEVGGWRVGLGICKDTRIDEHIDGTLALGIDLYVAGLVHHPDELADQDARGVRINMRGRIPVALASAAGWNGPAYPETAGNSCIWSSDGSVAARATAESGQVVAATLSS